MFSNSTKYALRTVLYLAQQEESQLYTVKELATHLDIPKPFLSKIMQRLSKNELIASSKGRGGGFYMSTQNKEHRLIDVIICIEGHNIFQKCILGLPACDDKNPCFLHEHFTVFKKELNDNIFVHTISDIIKEVSPSILQVVDR